MLTKLAKIHRIIKLTVRNCTIYEVLRKRKITVISTIPNDCIEALVIDGKIGKQIFLRIQCQTRGNIKLTVFAAIL